MNSNDDRPYQTDFNAVREATRAADRIAGSMPPPDTQRMVLAAAGPPTAAKPRGMIRTWALRGAVAAAMAATTVGVLLTVAPTRNADDPLPEHLAAFVDSLYSRDDFVPNDLAAVTAGASSTRDADFLGAIWQSVAAEVESR